MIKINEVQIKDLGSIEEEIFQPGAVAIRAGRNATGKSSGLKALRMALAGGAYR